MIILFKDRDRRISWHSIKSFSVDATEKKKIFKLNLIDNQNSNDAISVDIEEVLYKHGLIAYIPKYELKTVIKMINEKVKKNFEDHNFIKNIIRRCSSPIGDSVIEIDVEEIVFQNAKSVLSRIYALTKKELGEE